MWNKIVNFFMLRFYRLKKRLNQWQQSLESEFAEEFLQGLLSAMSMMFCVNKDFRRNIKGFNARYLFRSRDDKITIAAIFKGGKMKVKEKKIDNTNITITFKDDKALMKYLLSPKPDILGSILNQEVTYKGNLNYLAKFAFMAKRLQLMMTGKI